MLPKKNRLNTKDISFLIKKGQGLSSPLFSIKYLYKKEAESKFTIIVSNKITKKAHERNLLKRRVKNIIYKNLNNIKKGYHVAIFLKLETKNKNFSFIEDDIITLFKKAGLLY